MWLLLRRTSYSLAPSNHPIHTLCGYVAKRSQAGATRLSSWPESCSDDKMTKNGQTAQPGSGIGSSKHVHSIERAV